MKSFTVNRNDSGQRLDRVLLKMFPSLPRSLMYKEIRKKNIKVNKKRCDAAYTLCEGDIVELYLKDDVLQEKRHIMISCGLLKNLILYMRTKI